MRFSTQMLLLQLACVTAIVAICTGVFVGIGVQQLRAEAETSALSIARTVAADSDVRAGVAQASADAGTPTNASLRGGPLSVLAAAAEANTGALFIVITDDHGIRLAHPDPTMLGEVVSTEFAEALAGRETVSWESGTLGASARAKVPVRDPDTSVPVGEVSVGFAPSSVFQELPLLLSGVALAAGVALGLGAVVSFILRRRLERLTLGLQPEELSALVQNQAAVLDGVGDGVLAYGPDDVVTVANTTAARLLGVTDLVGRRIHDLALPGPVIAALAGEPSAVLTGRRATDAADPVVLADHVVYIDTHPVSRANRNLGVIAVIRDRTDVVTLTDRLETVASMTEALRVQRHEFANRLHVTAGLMDAGRVPDARDYLDDVLDASRAPGGPFAGEHLTEPFLLSLVEAKAAQAGERGVVLTVGPDSLVRGIVSAPADVATVLANLVDNAVTAAVYGAEPRWVDVELLDDGDTLVLTVSDSGSGVADESQVFSDVPRPDVDPDAVHGRGIGLPLVREIAARLGGEVWLADAGGPGGSGAVFCARLPGVMRAPARPGQGEER
ncbi:sensor histidine kinase [Cryobacterium arcticum]|uniref:histidine kinase n=1 Tax=Cryobacterium arcticum TaxID=670052 RepID=A0A1B1BIA0_9MICO|nr:sensor histidine kinase [Cryobacterium arcticum]ANP72238.1 Two-component system sensor protein [Cryobacterium arcticum]